MRTSDKYILKGKKIIPCINLTAWAEWFEDPERRRVARTDIDKDVWVSTVFLGLDHSFTDSGPPILFETMIFGGEEDQFMQRYATYDQAETGHNEIVARLQERRTSNAN